MEANYRKNPKMGEGFGLDMENWSPQGHAELVTKFRHRPDDPVGQMLMAHPDKMIERSADGMSLVGRPAFRLRPTRSREQAVELAREVIDRYATDISATNELADAVSQRKAKLTAIIRVCQDLDQMHLFTDGNIRTITFLVLNKLLIEQGFSPAIMDEPNAFDCMSVAELTALVLAGQQTYQKYAS
ncbi:hypothetical protein ASC95_09665 [Pelomonas sp. Root1217]|uniref:hypothetical protein n=1 Tax=Pelomonas sp. Root1217 TaxID=1736430 RepID=UPI00071441B4|nr:hypothetical protein [Pelomonas sp. Root1217]KQV53028.1 hypothetical protein ASC95_09665 [Pelomonas sp. Root1217]